MRNRVCYIALLSLLVSACSSVPETPMDAPPKLEPVKAPAALADELVPASKIAPVEINERKKEKSPLQKESLPPLITQHKWRTLEFTDQKSLVSLLQSNGLSLGKMVNHSDTDTVINGELLRGQPVTVVHDGDGVVLSLYGRAETGDILSIVNADGTFVLAIPDGQIMEPVIQLSVTPRTSIDNLGLTQKLVLKHALRDMERDEAERVLQNERIDLSFKALFIQGRITGPIKVLSFDRTP